MKRQWTCRRVAGGVRCMTINPARLKKCSVCSKPRPARKKPAHMQALDLPYEHYLQLNGGVEACGICGRLPGPKRKLDRDHCHTGENAGKGRGLLCHVCNRALWQHATPGWLRAAAAYLERSERGGVHVLGGSKERAA